jgi:hypothetical protein
MQTRLKSFINIKTPINIFKNRNQFKLSIRNMSNNKNDISTNPLLSNADNEFGLPSFQKIGTLLSIYASMHLSI